MITFRAAFVATWKLCMRAKSGARPLVTAAGNFW
jgi:hypothetical protein